mgnify:FL=1
MKTHLQTDKLLSRYKLIYLAVFIICYRQCLSHMGAVPIYWHWLEKSAIAGFVLFSCSKFVVLSLMRPHALALSSSLLALRLVGNCHGAINSYSNFHVYIILDFPITHINVAELCKVECACLHKTVNMAVFYVKSNENTYPKGRALM